MRTVMLATLLALGFLLPSGAAWSQDHDHPAGDEQALGEVEFPTSCDPAVQETFESAVAMLHSFWYTAAERRFVEIGESDPECAMAHWGIAMSGFRQLWTAPSDEDLEAGRAALAKARSIGTITERERGYIEALFAFYEGDDRDHLERKIAYEKAMEEIHRRNPDDPEAAIFHALAVLGVAYFSPPDDSFARQKKAGAILERVFAERTRHPGIAHYLIHSYDFPELAERGEKAARQYAEIAPSAPHALHMPSHIFTRLGLWEESIESNRAAAAAAHEDGWYGEELHASDYLTYAYLQMGRDAEAREMLRKVPALTGLLSEDDTNYGAGLYGAAAIPTRYAVERRAWEEAAALTLPTARPDGPLCWTEGPLHFARGLGAIHTGDLEKARQTVSALERCGDAVTRGVWATRTEVLQRAVGAWLAWAEGREEEALAEMRSAADLEDASDKPPVTPGSVVPARELLGEMLLAAGRPAEALGAFEASLEESPRRFRSLLGAARAAREAGDEQVARAYYARLLELAGSDAPRPEIAEAKRFASPGSGARDAPVEPHPGAGEHAVLVEGLGSYSRPISTDSDSAQRFFDQGLQLTMGYYFPEAIASFREGLRYDPGHPMLLWGLALAAGPNPNSRAGGFPDDPEGAARRAMREAVANLDRATETERAFVRTLAVRFDEEAEPDRASRDAAYVEATRDLFHRYPEDPDAGALLADALMTQSPWSYWSDDGSASAGTAEASAALEHVLERQPDHPWSNHLYIHLYEASPTPQRAEPQADRLEALLPGIGHAVHMPSHIYVPVGRYEAANAQNERSIAADEAFLEAWGDRPFPSASTYPLSASFHSWHAMDFIRFANSLGGNAARALEAAREAPSHVPPDRRRSGMAQRLEATVWVTEVVFGRWEEILSERPPPDDLPYLQGMWRYARGRAFAATGEAEKAEAELEKLIAIADDPAISELHVVGNLAPTVLRLAAHLLRGELAVARGDLESALPHLRAAVRMESRLTYKEPPDWPFPARHQLGAALLASGRPAEAEAVYRRDLAAFQGNGWALWGLWQSLEAQGRKKEAADARSRFEEAWRGADVELPIMETQETERWWPHPLWGPDDQAGGSNWITPEKVLEAIKLVETGKIYELGHVYERGMPTFGGRTYATYVPATQGATLGEDLVYNEEVVIAEIGQVGTQFDGPAHVGKRVTHEDGTTEKIFYNGVRWSEMQDPYAMRKLGVENVRPYLTRGVLIDVAGYTGVGTLPDGYVVTLEDVRGALAAQGMSEDDIRPGDAVLFNFGWWRLWPEPKAMGLGWPGIGREVARWVVERQASMVGSDAATDEATQWAVHDLLTVQHGIFNLEMMQFEELLADEVYEFLFVFTPLRLKGASGSPGRPVAIR